MKALERSHHYSLGFSDAQGQLIPKLVMEYAEIQTHSSFNVGLVTCKNEEDPSKNEGTRVVTTFLP